MIEIPDLVTGGLAVGMLSAVALGGGLLHAQRQQARQRAEIAALRHQLGDALQALTAEVEHLGTQRLPAAARQLAHPHVAVPGPLHPQTSGTPLGLALEHVLTGLRTELIAQRTRVDAAAQAGMRGATREIQAALYRLQDALRGLQQKYDDPELTQTLFQLDHENEQSLRRAQVAAVVCGAWVGLAREESHLVDAVTGGQARLAGYHRIRVHNHLAAGTGLVSHAVEPVAIIVAELLDNALRHSAPDTDVVVNLEHVHHGACVTVDDAGLGMTQDERARAQRLVAGSEPILLTELGDPPRMGLAAIGQLTRQFDLSVDVSSPSPYGGVRAVLRVDSHLLSRIDPDERPPAASAPRPTRKASHDQSSARARDEASVASRGEEPLGSRGREPLGSRGGEPLRSRGDESSGPRGETADGPHGGSSGGPRGETSGSSRGENSGDPRGEASVGSRDEPAASSRPRTSGTSHGYGAEHDHDASGTASGHHAPREAGGLPQRRRRTRPAAASDDTPAPRPEVRRPDPGVRRPERAAAALGALQAGTSAARSAAGERTGDASTAVPESAGAARRRAEATADDTDQTDHEGGTAR
ncbi:sensor histidine kinase [Streptomyces sp. AS02]|uniref:ATP-binding protein n=1 Tax=Streptomyces sp. AS02 TaxID=2938946 RepID=UPI002020DE03|nr:ATP-binding protein [Streptomyces sp. AS02]MCL8010197.1 protein kinase [Streptomyces sp. AS02]